MQFGTRMEGNEQDFEELIKNYLKDISQKEDFTYLEIGVSEGLTFKSIKEISGKNNVKNNNLTHIGIDVQEGLKYNYEGWKEKFKDDTNIIYVNDHKKIDINKLILPNLANIVICEANVFLTSYFDNKIDICLIDGCHGYNCVKNNFLNVEKFIKPNGIVIFHDAGAIEQRTDFQPHCNDLINVRLAIEDLGLFSNKRNGWQFIKETNGTRKIGLTGNSSAIFKKI
jgi:hypothetical protein